MSKFPDPTKNYEAAPVAGAIDLSKTSSDTPDTPIYTAPSSTQPLHIESPQATREMPPDAQQSGGPPPVYSPPPLPPTPPPAPILPPAPSSSPFRNLVPLLIGIAAIILLLVVGFTLVPKLFKKSTPVTLNYWGLWEPTSVLQAVIADYEAANPNVKINYSMQSPKNYRARAFANNNASSAPDIIRIHNTWLPMLRKNLAPAPDTVLKVSDLSDYYPIVQKDFVVGNKIYGLPLEIDGLALLYNADIFDEAQLSPPSDWNSLRKIAFDLTRTNAETGIIERAGIAMGTTNNVEHWSDILGLLILQNSGNPAHPSETAVADALTFYTIISNTDHSWDASQPNSVYAFATGTVAMILAPSWQIAEIKAINPELNFAVAPAPVLPSANIAWATYWGEAVPGTSAHPEEAWKFIKYLSTAPALQKMYAGASAIRPLGEPYPLISLSGSLASDPFASTFVAQGPNYRSWYMASRTYDEGLNDQLIKYYEDAVNAMNEGSGVGGVIKTLDEGVTQVLAKFPEAQ